MMTTGQNVRVSSIETVMPAAVAITELKARARAILSNEFEGWQEGGLVAALEGLDRIMGENAPQTGKVVAMRAPVLGPAPVDLRSKLLIVDDDPFTFALLEDTFEESHTVLRATNGMAALEMAVDHMPDLILLDVMMPGMNGYDVCRRLKADGQTRDIPVMFITGLGDLTAETRGLELGAVDYITKPLNPAAVRARVNNQVRLKWALDRLKQMAEMEHMLRDDILEVLEFKLKA